MDPTITLCSNGYALVCESPTGPIAITLTTMDADRCFDAGVNYDEDCTGKDGAAIHSALQAIL